MSYFLLVKIIIKKTPVNILMVKLLYGIQAEKFIGVIKRF